MMATHTKIVLAKKKRRNNRFLNTLLIKSSKRSTTTIIGIKGCPMFQLKPNRTIIFRITATKTTVEETVERIRTGLLINYKKRSIQRKGATDCYSTNTSSNKKTFCLHHRQLTQTRKTSSLVLMAWRIAWILQRACPQLFIMQFWRQFRLLQAAPPMCTYQSRTWK